MDPIITDFAQAYGIPLATLGVLLGGITSWGKIKKAAMRRNVRKALQANVPVHRDVLVIQHSPPSDWAEEPQNFRACFDMCLAKGLQPVDASWIAQRTVELMRTDIGFTSAYMQAALEHSQMLVERTKLA